MGGTVCLEGWVSHSLRRGNGPGLESGRRCLPLAHGCAWGLGAGLVALAVLLSPGGEAPPFISFPF